MTDKGRAEKISLLSRCELFDGLAGLTLQRLADRAYYRDYPAGALIFGLDGPGDSMMVVAQGTVRISVMAPTARDVILTELSAGSAFGEIALLDGGGRTADAHAQSNCTLLILERRALLQVMRADPDVAVKLLELLCARLRRSEERMMDFAFLRLPARLARTLLRLTDGAAPGGAGQSQRLALSQADLADMVGSSRENVNRCLHRWQGESLVVVKDGWIGLSDRPTLERLAEAG